jgi:putative SOS response-associated peptidase YedK
MPHFYRLDLPAAAVARAFGVAAGDDPWRGGPVAPHQFAPVITAGREFIAGARPTRGPRRMVPRLWGVPPPPSAADQRRAVLTVRNPESPFWIGNLRNIEFRCLVPVTSFSEWGAGIDTEGRRLRHVFGAGDRGVLAIAGVWKDSEVPSFALVTCPARGEARAHGVERLPVILPRADHDAWLYGGWERAGALIAPAPEGTLYLLD